jgi:two-component system, OmpR family, alkaline phosphatase synthesis response regulator PhoP
MSESRRIFIVDDDQDMVALMTALLESRGHTVKSNLVAALAISEILEMRPHGVLIDLVMGETDGYALTGELKKHRELQHTRLVMVSARTNPIWTERSREAGLDGFITKPIDMATFAQQVEALLD